MIPSRGLHGIALSAHPGLCLTLHRQALILLLAEDDERVVLAAWGGLDALAATIPKEDAPNHVTAVKEAVLGAKEKVWGG